MKARAAQPRDSEDRYSHVSAAAPLMSWKLKRKAGSAWRVRQCFRAGYRDAGGMRAILY